MVSTVFQTHGSRFDRAINQDDISKIKDANSLRDINSVWGKIADWFCGTHKEAAKTALFKLMHEQLSDGEKLETFNALRDLATQPFKSQFQYSVVTDNSVLLNIKDTNLDIEVNTRSGNANVFTSSVLDAFDDAGMEQGISCMLNDITRSDYNIEGTHYFSTRDDIDSEEKETVAQTVLEHCHTDFQKEWVGRMASQASILGVFNSLISAGIDRHLLPVGATNQKVLFEINTMESGDVKIDVKYSNNAVGNGLLIAKQNDAYKKLDMELSLLVGQNSLHCTKLIYDGVLAK